MGPNVVAATPSPPAAGYTDATFEGSLIDHISGTSSGEIYMEIVDHVNDLNFFIKSTSFLLKKNGIMFVATLNKTLKSYLLAIIGAEYVMNWLPVGTHDWFKFVEPEKLRRICKKNNLELLSTEGLNYNILLDKWNLSNNTDVNYISKFKKI